MATQSKRTSPAQLPTANSWAAVAFALAVAALRSSLPTLALALAALAALHDLEGL